MGERSKNREAVERVAKRIKDHRDQQGGGMTSATEASREAAEVARRSDNEKAQGGNRNQRRRTESEPSPEPRNQTGRIFVDLGKKG